MRSENLTCTIRFPSQDKKYRSCIPLKKKNQNCSIFCEVIVVKAMKPVERGGMKAGDLT